MHYFTPTIFEVHILHQ